MTEQPHCPRCGTQLPADAPAGLCPKCLVQAGLESEPPPHSMPAATMPSPASSGFEPLSVESLAGKFPQLEILELLGKGGIPISPPFFPEIDARLDPLSLIEGRPDLAFHHRVSINSCGLPLGTFSKSSFTIFVDGHESGRRTPPEPSDECEELEH